MSWTINLSKEAQKFLTHRKGLDEEIFELTRKSIRKLQGEDINVDVKKLKGDWQGFYRGRIGGLRVILEFDFDNSSVFIERIDYRGGVYK